MGCSPPGSSVHGISQARILELPFPPPGDLSNPGLLHWLSDSLPLSNLGSIPPSFLFLFFIVLWQLYLIFHFLFCLCSLFSLWLTWPDVCQACLSFQERSSCFYSSCFLNFYFIYFLSDIYYFLSYADFRFCLFVCLFILLSCRLDCLFQNFLFS